MRYTLDWFRQDGRKGSAKITSEQFARVKAGREILMASYGIEQRFDILLASWIEFETIVAMLAIEHSVHIAKVWTDDDETRSLLNRRFIALLTAAIGYKEQVSRCRSGNSAACKALSDEALRMSFPLRAVKVIRDHSQHSALPLVAYSIPMRWERESKTQVPVKRVHGFGAFISVNEMSSAVRHRDSIWSELAHAQDEDGNIAVAPLTRRLLEDLSSLHEQVRILLLPIETNAIVQIEELRALRTPDAAGEYLAAFSMNDNRIVETFHLGNEIEMSLVALRKRNQVPLTMFGKVAFEL